MRRLFTSLLLMVGSLLPAVAQHTLDSLVMVVSLRRDGSAKIQELRYMNIGHDGTECFIKQYNMGDMTVDSLDVWEKVTGSMGQDSLITYTLDTPWDVNRSRSQKAFHCGFNDTPEGQEICWGIGEPGRHKYIINYCVHGLVKSYSDFDGFNHNFYEAATPAADYVRIVYILDPDDYVTICIPDGDSIITYPFYSNFVIGDDDITFFDDDSVVIARHPVANAYLDRDTLSRDTASIWAFGYYGEIFFTDDGRVAAVTSDPMDQGSKMIVMMRFRKGLFQPSLSYPDQSFETDVKELAFIDSDYDFDDEGEGSDASRNGGELTPMWVHVLLTILGASCCIGLPLVLLIYSLFGTRISRWWDRRRVRKLLADAPQYYHEPPLGGQLLRSRRILRVMEPNLENSEIKLVEAYVLRLLNYKILDVVDEITKKGETRQVFKVSAPDDVKDLLADATDDNKLLLKLQTILYTAAGDDHLLQPTELNDLVHDNPIMIRSFARDLRGANTANIYIENIKRDEAQQVYGFWNFLNDFTLVKERAIQEVALWNDYLVFATLFGIADKVRADMRKIAPDLQVFDKLTREIVDSTTPVALLCSSLTNHIIDAAERTIYYETDAERRIREAMARRAEARERRSGGGGRSSYGGGGGYSGGGGSGVR